MSEEKLKRVKFKKLKKYFKNKKYLLTSIIFLVVLTFFSIVAYAWHQNNVRGNDTAKGANVTTSIKALTITDNTALTYSNIYPGWSTTKTFSVTNTGNVSVAYKLIWKQMANSFTRTGDIKYTITSTNGGGTISNANLPSTGTNILIQNSILIHSGETQTYTVAINYLDLEVNQGADIGKSFSGIIDITEGAVPVLFADTLKTNNPPTAYTTTPRQSLSTTDEGLISGPDDEYGDKTYYFRGTAPDNYVTFAGKTWRIVRINGDGSVRLILNTTSGVNSAWNSNYVQADNLNISTAKEYFKYSNSTIKTAVDNWYSSNIGNNPAYARKVATTKFCNDTMYATSYATYYFVYNYLRNNGYTGYSVQFTCPNSNDVYNLNAGLITSDELTFAGAKHNSANTSYYLYNSSITSHTWTMSPTAWTISSGYIYVDYIPGGSSAFDDTGITTSYSFRPVISIEKYTTVTTTSPTNPGTSANPYIIQ